MNINNQTENKKPFGTRLFILFTVCMIVVAMTVPAFAYDIDYVSPVPYPAMMYDNYVVMLTGSYVYLFSFDEILYRSPNNMVFNGNYERWFRLTSQNEWTGYNSGSGPLTYNFGTLLYTTTNIYDEDGDLVFEGPPPPPDLGQEVTGVLPTVLSWIQQTLNALFVEGGALQGLLLLVAVPVAITLLFLAARFIRNLIWGA